MLPFFVDTLPVTTPTVLVAAADFGKAQSNIRVYGVCHVVSNLPWSEISLENSLSPAAEAVVSISRFEGKDLAGYENSAKIEILINPKHGSIQFDAKKLGYFYVPEVGYLGKDRATFQVEIGGRIVKLKYFIHAIDGAASGNTAYERNCGKRVNWKISQPSAEGSNDLASWISSTSFSALLAGASHSLNGFDNLLGSTLGETKDSDPTTPITLETTAASHGWHIDYTPT